MWFMPTRMTFMAARKPSSNSSALPIFARSVPPGLPAPLRERAGVSGAFLPPYVNLCTELRKFTPMNAEISTTRAAMDSTAIFLPFHPMASRWCSKKA